MLLLINEVIGRAPDYDATGLVGRPLNAVLDWCMGTPAGFAAFRSDAINAMFRKSCGSGATSSAAPIALRAERFAAGWMCDSAKKATRSSSSSTTRRQVLGFHVVERLLHQAIQAGRPADRGPRRPVRYRQRLRIDAVRDQDEREAARPVLGQVPALFAARHAGQRPIGRAVRRRDGVPGIPQRVQLSPLA